MKTAIYCGRIEYAGKAYTAESAAKCGQTMNEKEYIH